VFTTTSEVKGGHIMRLHHRLSIISLALCLVSIPLDSGLVLASRATEAASIKTELAYYKQAAILNDLLFREGTPVHMNVVITMLKEIDKNLIKYYPEGPFTRNDLIALAWVESGFKQYIGGTHGERGIFQIMPDEFRDFSIHKNYYNVDVNTHMAFRVLDSKYKRYRDYKKAIMAYNGLIKFKSGRYSQKYWKAFERRKIAVDLVLNDR
jgi:hypothetical protein